FLPLPKIFHQGVIFPNQSQLMTCVLVLLMTKRSTSITRICLMSCLHLEHLLCSLVPFTTSCRTQTDILLAAVTRNSSCPNWKQMTECGRRSAKHHETVP